MTNRKSKIKINGRKALVINEVAKLHGVTTQYVRVALKGEQQNDTTELLVKDYNRLYKALENVFK